VTLTDRDRKVVMLLVPLLLIAGYWFLLLAPKREAVSKAGESLAKQERKRDQAVAHLQQLEGAKTTFASDYSQVVRLGKAIPTKVDMPSLLVQLEESADGTGISVSKIALGGSSEDGTSGGGQATPPAAPGGSGDTPPAAGGGQPAQSTPGQQSEKSANDVNSANAQNGAKDQQQGGGLPVGGGSTGGAAGSGGAPSCPAGLQCVPLEFEFTGRFFKLADFFHRLKRFVHVANRRIRVQGRLLTVDGLAFKSEQELFPAIKAEVKATVYLAPASEGAAAGATPKGPAPAAPGNETQPVAPTATNTP
jgi:hypothetical protein